jgi:hypothetical protein
MKTELRAAPHSTLPGAAIVEVWHDGRFIATVVHSDGPGVRVISKYSVLVKLPESRIPSFVEVENHAH